MCVCVHQKPLKLLGKTSTSQKKIQCVAPAEACQTSAQLKCVAEKQPCQLERVCACSFLLFEMPEC